MAACFLSRLTRRAVFLGASVLAAAGFCATTMAQDQSLDLQRWQAQADRLRLTLLAPQDPSGWVLDSFDIRRGGCGEGLATVIAKYRRAGAEISFDQAYPGYCGNFGHADEDGSIALRGQIATFLWGSGGRASSVRMLHHAVLTERSATRTPSPSPGWSTALAPRPSSSSATLRTPTLLRPSLARSSTFSPCRSGVLYGSASVPG